MCGLGSIAYFVTAVLHADPSPASASMPPELLDDVDIAPPTPLEDVAPPAPTELLELLEPLEPLDEVPPPVPICPPAPPLPLLDVALLLVLPVLLDVPSPPLPVEPVGGVIGDRPQAIESQGAASASTIGRK